MESFWGVTYYGDEGFDYQYWPESLHEVNGEPIPCNVSESLLSFWLGKEGYEM